MPGFYGPWYPGWFGWGPGYGRGWGWRAFAPTWPGWYWGPGYGPVYW